MCISSRCGFRHYRHDVFLYRASYPWLLLRKALVGLSTGTRERNTGRPLRAVQAQTCQAGSAQGGVAGMGTRGAPVGCQALPASLPRPCNSRKQHPVSPPAPPPQDFTLAAPLCQQERPGCVGGGRVCKHQAWAVWQHQESAWRCSKPACLAGKEGERRGAGEGEPALSPRVAIFSQAI